MKQKARHTTTERVWSVQTNDTYMLHARIPLDLMERLRAYVTITGATITDTTIKALDDYLKSSGA